MSNHHIIQITQTSWDTSSQALSFVRQQVFTQEQKVPEDLEWDGKDPHCQHVLATHRQQGPIGTGRILENGQIGRMAILPAYRRQGIGSGIMQELIDIAQKNQLESVFIHAQLTATEFYFNFQFMPEGPTFMDAGIAHVKMVKIL